MTKERFLEINGLLCAFVLKHRMSVVCGDLYQKYLFTVHSGMSWQEVGEYQSMLQAIFDDLALHGVKRSPAPVLLAAKIERRKGVKIGMLEVLYRRG